MPLYGHEMDDQTTPLEASLGFCVKLAKSEFVGRDALVSAGEPRRIRVGLVATGRGIIREHQDVYVGDGRIGTTTSGTFAPHLRQAIAMAIVDVAHATTGTEVEVDVRGHRIAARIVPMPFYRHA
jgi:aminomethyltransferase